MKITKQFMAEMMEGKHPLTGVQDSAGWMQLDSIRIVWNPKTQHADITLYTGRTPVAATQVAVDFANGSSLTLSMTEGLEARLQLRLE